MLVFIDELYLVVANEVFAFLQKGGLASIYCKFGVLLESYLGYMDMVLLFMSSFPVILDH